MLKPVKSDGIPASAATVGRRLDRWLSTLPGVRSFVRSGVQIVNSPFAKARLNTVLASTDRPVWLEIGGHTPRERWVVTNVNAVTRLYLDATKRWPLEDGSVKYLYSDNVIEHLTLAAGRAMLREARRCMIPGGAIRIVTPDLRTHVDMYLHGAESLSNDVAAHYRDIGLDVEHPVDLVRIPVASFGHHAGYIYDFETLAAELRNAGFHDPVRCAPGQSAHTAMSGLELRTHEGPAQLAVEATA